MDDRNSIVPLIPIMLDRQRFLRLDISALCNAERDLSDFWGKKTSVYSVLLDVPIGINDLSILVLHGLRHEDPTLSLGEVKGMLNHTTVAIVLNAVTDAWMKATQAAAPTEGDADPADPPSTTLTGVSSGPMPASTSDSAALTSGS
jgi:hypothetical protein